MTKNWPTVRLGEVLKPVSRDEAVDPLGQYRLLGVRLDGQGPFLREVVSGTQTSATRLYRVAKGDFIYSRLFASRGAFGVIDGHLDGCHVSGEFPTFMPVAGRVEVKFLQYWFHLPTTIARVTEDCTGSTPLTRNRFKEHFFLALEAPLPTLMEQRRVVARIEELTAQVQEARILRQHAEEESKAMIRARVSEVDQIMRRKHKLTTLNSFASGEKGSLRSGPFGSALLHEEFVALGVPAIGIQDVQENRFVLTRRWNVTLEKADELNRFTIKPRDILVTVMGTLGRACVVPDEIPRMVSTKHVWTISLDQGRVEPQWVSFWLNYSPLVRKELLGQGTGTAIAGLNGGKVRNLSLPNIPLSEQRRIVVQLNALQSQVDALKRLQAESSVELEALLRAVFERTFKGEL